MFGRRILILSEDQLLVELVATNLGKRGYQVACTSVKRADPRDWEGFGTELLLLDTEPPGCGLAIAAKVLGDLGWKDRIPVVVLCNEAPDGDGVNSRRGLHWVVKPFAVDVLLSTIKKALGEWQGSSVAFYCYGGEV